MISLEIGKLAQSGPKSNALHTGNWQTVESIVKNWIWDI